MTHTVLCVGSAHVKWCKDDCQGEQAAELPSENIEILWLRDARQVCAVNASTWSRVLQKHSVPSR